MNSKPKLWFFYVSSSNHEEYYKDCIGIVVNCILKFGTSSTQYDMTIEQNKHYTHIM